MNSNSRVEKITGTAIFSCLIIVFQLLANFLPPIGPVTFNLSLIPIAVGAMIYGPVVGIFLGLVDGIIVLFAPSTIAIFYPCSVIGTIITCLIKTPIAALIASLTYSFFKRKNKEKIGIILASLLTPIINTTIFALLALLFFTPFLNSLVEESFNSIYEALLFGVIGINFLSEFAINLILSPTIISIINIYKRKK